MPRLAQVFIATLAAASMAGAAENTTSWRYLVEVFGSVGHGRAGTGRSAWGSGPEFGGGVGFRPFPGRAAAVGFELQVAALNRERAGVISDSLDSTMFAANALYHFFSARRAQPYVSAGAGYLKADYHRVCSACVFDVDPITGQLTPIIEPQEIRTRRAVIVFGTGVKIALHRRLWLRPEILGSGGDKSILRYRIALGLHF